MKHFFKKNMTMKLANKIVSVLVIFSFTTAMLMPLKDADAQVDAIGGPFQIFSTVYNEAKQIGLETILKQAAIAMANQLLNQMIDSTANWVAGGFDGKPLFIQNPGQFFGNVASNSANEFLGRLQSGVFTGSKEWLRKAGGDAEVACYNQGIGGNTGAAFIDYIYGLVNPGMVGDGATGQQTFSQSEIQSFYDQNNPVTPQEVVTFAATKGITLDPTDISSNSLSNKVSASACACEKVASDRLAAQEDLDIKSKEELAAFLADKGSNMTVQSYLDKNFDIKSCVDFQSEDGNKPDFIAAGGYTRGVIQFLGSTYEDKKGAIASLAPNYQGLPKEVQKQVSQNWSKFATSNGNFNAGGWDSWNQYATPNNNPLASKFLFQNALKQQANYEVKTFKDELKDGNGFLGAKKCLVKEVDIPGGGKKCPTDQLVTTTPGQIVGDQLAKALNTPLDKTKSVNSWGDVLSVALTRMASKLTTAGITALTNEANRQINIEKGTYAGLGGDILAKTSSTNNGAGTGATEVLDLEEFFLGKPVQKMRTNSQGQPMYEPIIDQATGEPQLDTAGNVVVDTNKPMYLYEQQVDALGSPVFETKEVYIGLSLSPDFLSLHPEVIVEEDGKYGPKYYVKEPVYDLTKPVYEDGYAFFLEGGRPVMEEGVAEDHELVVVSFEKAGEGRVRLLLKTPNAASGINLSKRVITWKDVKNEKVMKVERGGTTLEDNLGCPVGGCHNTYEATITDNNGGSIYKLISVWRNLENGVVVWKSEISGSSEAAPSSGELKLADGKNGTTAIPLYQKNDAGDIIYEPTRDATGVIVKDASGNPIPDTTKPKRAALRRGGAIARVYYMNWILSKERAQIRQLPQAAKALDQCVPGPDYGWDKRLQSKYDKLTQKYGGKKPEQVNHLLSPLKEIGQAVYTIMSSYQEGNPPEGCTGSKWLEPIDHNKIEIKGKWHNTYQAELYLSSTSIDLSEVTVKWKNVNVSTPENDKTDDGIQNVVVQLINVAGLGEAFRDIYVAEITLPSGVKVFKRISIWTWWRKGTLEQSYGREEGWSEGFSQGIGQSIYNLTGNSNLGLDCSGTNWYQQYNGAGYTWGYLTLNAKDMQWLAGYDLTDTGEFIPDSKGNPKKILNIPSASVSREVFDSARTKYSRKYKQIAEQQSEIIGIKRNIDKLYDQYEEGARDKNLIAKDVVALREDLPFSATINRERLLLQQINEDIEKVYKTTQDCWEEKTKPEYYDIYFKDEMQVLYCPLQFHGKMNVAPRIDQTYPEGVNYEQQRQDVLKVMNKKTQKDLRETLKSMPKGLKITRYIFAGLTGGASELFLLQVGAIVDAFSDTTAEKYASWLSHPSPNLTGNGGQGGSRPKNSEYMCWETSYEESENAGDKGEDKKIDTTGEQCFGQSDDERDGQPAGAGKFAVERLELLCKDFYKSSLSDYNELFGVTQNNTTP